MTPGTTATATVRGLPGVPVMAVADGDHAGWLSAYPVGTFTFHPDDQIADLVQTFPLDLGPGDLDALDQAITGQTTDTTVPALTALRDRITAARTGAAKPTEPTVRGSVVVDVNGREWVRVGAPNATTAWFQYATKRYAVAWAEVEAVRVVR